MAQKKRGSGTSLTLGMCSGVQRRGGGGTGHDRLLRAHAGPRGRWRQTGQPPHKASNQSAPIHCRWHRDPTGGRMGVGDQGEESLGVRSAQSRLPADRTRVNSHSSRLFSSKEFNRSERTVQSFQRMKLMKTRATHNQEANATRTHLQRTRLAKTGHEHPPKEPHGQTVLGECYKPVTYITFGGFRLSAGNLGSVHH